MSKSGLMAITLSKHPPENSIIVHHNVSLWILSYNKSVDMTPFWPEGKCLQDTETSPVAYDTAP